MTVKPMRLLHIVFLCLFWL